MKKFIYFTRKNNIEIFRLVKLIEIILQKKFDP